MSVYASGTTVSVEKSKAELDKLLAVAGAHQRSLGSDDQRGMAFVIFAIKANAQTAAVRQVRLELALPKISDFQRIYGRRGKSPEQRYEQACRERWRLLVLLVKAKLEAVAAGITTVEREFLADVLLPDGKTVHRVLEAGIAESYATGTMPRMLGMGSGEP